MRRPFEEEPLNRCATVPGAGQASVMYPRKVSCPPAFARALAPPDFVPPDDPEPGRAASLADDSAVVPPGGTTRSTSLVDAIRAVQAIPAHQIADALLMLTHRSASGYRPVNDRNRKAGKGGGAGRQQDGQAAQAMRRARTAYRAQHGREIRSEMAIALALVKRASRSSCAGDATLTPAKVPETPSGRAGAGNDTLSRSGPARTACRHRALHQQGGGLAGLGATGQCRHFRRRCASARR